ncbi:molybdopterin oxidoreductase family protein [Evansella sp. AB-P1]|nr:molybdopterin oxidoreductase family protein [Evansella sp. AB-P1]MDG5787526.1 molybdopterin oxidoreductase family protein [Evansella sp. AB-P1]
MSYERLDREYGLQYPCPTEDHPGTKVIHTEFYESHDKVSPFTSVSYTPPVELPDEEYPFTLTTGRRYEPYNTHTQTKYYPETLKRKQTEETVDMHPENAEVLEVSNGDWVTVRSRRGEVKVKVKVTDQVQPDLVFMSFHWSEVPTNALTIDEFDPISGTAEYKACAVQIKKL